MGQKCDRCAGRGYTERRRKNGPVIVVTVSKCSKCGGRERSKAERADMHAATFGLRHP